MYIRVNTILEVKGASGAGNVECVKVLNPYNKSRAGGFILARVLSLSEKRDPNKRQAELGKVYKALIITKKERFSVGNNRYHTVYNSFAVLISLTPVEDWS